MWVGDRGMCGQGSGGMGVWGQGPGLGEQGAGEAGGWGEERGGLGTGISRTREELTHVVGSSSSLGTEASPTDQIHPKPSWRSSCWSSVVC